MDGWMERRKRAGGDKDRRVLGAKGERKKGKKELKLTDGRLACRFRHPEHKKVLKLMKVEGGDFCELVGEAEGEGDGA